MGVTEEAPKVTDPTPHFEWPHRMRVGLIECEGEKGSTVRKCRLRPLSLPTGWEREGGDSPHTEELELHIHFAEENR